MTTRTKSKMASYYAQRKKYHKILPHTDQVFTEDLSSPPSVFMRSLDPWNSMGLTLTTSALTHPGITLQEKVSVSDCVMAFIMIRPR